MTIDLWTEASVDHTARENAERLSRAKVAAANLWPFLSLAQSAQEFDHRLALVADRLDETTPADLHERVTASLREDWLSMQANGYGSDLGGWGDRQREMNPAWYDPGMDNVGKTPGPHGDEDDAVSHAEKATRLYPGTDGKINGADYDAIQRHLPEGSPYKRAALSPEELAKKTPDAQGRYKLDPANPNDARLIRQRQSDNHDQRDRYDDYDDQRANAKGASIHEAAWWDEHDQHGATQDMDEHGDGSMWDHEATPSAGSGSLVHHPAGWTAHADSQGATTIGHEATPGAVYDMVDPTQHGDPRDALHAWVDAGHGRWAEHNVPSIRDHIRQLKTSSRQTVQFFHEGSQRWVTASVDQGPVGEGQNPYYFSGGAELGVNTFNTGQFPQFPAGPDPVDPLNSMFPQDQPGDWSDKGGWHTNDMHLMPGASNYAVNGAAPANPARNAARKNAADGWKDEGVQTGTGPNPYFFSGGEEGVNGGQDAAFPTDPQIVGNPTVQQGTLPQEPLQADVLEMYQNMGPTQTYQNAGMGQLTGSFSQMAASLGSRHPFA